MNKIEANGRTLEEAIEVAAKDLGVETSAVGYEIVDQGAKGFLGIGGTPCLIRAWEKSGNIVETAQVKSSKVVEPVQKKTINIPEAVSEPVQKSIETDDEFANAALRVLTNVLDAMKIDAHAILKSVNEDEVNIDIKGSEVAILIGRQGQTLDALQYLIGLAAIKKIQTHQRLILDAEGYRDRHNKIIMNKAKEYAEAVKAHNKEAVLDPQPARERRLVHLAFVDDPDVYTYSEGEGESRHVVISPKTNK